MKTKTIVNAALGIAAEVLYAVSLILAAFLICWALYIKR
jgi:hypothetical protein